MLINWTKDKTYDWFIDAGNYTGYYKRLAERLLPFLPAGGSLVDIGCGMGLVDLELKDYFTSITCIDKSEKALLWLTNEVSERGIGNIKTMCADARTLDCCFDSAIALFCGMPQDFSGPYLDLVRDTLIVVTHPRNRFADLGNIAEKHMCADVTICEQHFKKIGLKYTLIEDSIEFGQPFRDIDDAKEYTANYFQNRHGETVDEFLEQNLRQISDDKFKYYLPKLRKFGIFVIKK